MVRKLREWYTSNYLEHRIPLQIMVDPTQVPFYIRFKTVHKPSFPKEGEGTTIDPNKEDIQIFIAAVKLFLQTSTLVKDDGIYCSYIVHQNLNNSKEYMINFIKLWLPQKDMLVVLKKLSQIVLMNGHIESVVQDTHWSYPGFYGFNLKAQTINNRTLYSYDGFNDTYWIVKPELSDLFYVFCSTLTMLTILL